MPSTERGAGFLPPAGVLRTAPQPACRAQETPAAEHAVTFTEESRLLSSLAISLPCHSGLFLDIRRCAVSATPMSSEPLKDSEPSPPALHPTAGHLTT
ncbi:unnamed protein product, partial [Rangifer tarandus platyrhynchus]